MRAMCLSQVSGAVESKVADSNIAALLMRKCIGVDLLMSGIRLWAWDESPKSDLNIHALRSIPMIVS